MVNYCTICMNNNRTNKNISYFTYPREQTRLLEWLKAVDREDLLPKLTDNKTRQQHRICEEHFEEDCIVFSKKGTIKYLTADAFPTLKLRSLQGPSMDQGNTAGTSTSHWETVYLQEDTVTETYVSDNDVKTLHCCKIDLDDDKPSNSKAQWTQQNTSRGTRTKKLVSNPFTTDFFKVCNNSDIISKGMCQILKWQTDYKKNGNKYSNVNFNLFALNLHFSSQEIYRFLSHTLNLPPLATLKTNFKPKGTKLDKHLLAVLKMKVDKMDAKEKICSISVDSTSVKPSLFYDITNDKIIGFHEYNGIQRAKAAEHCVVIMVHGIIYNWKQPIAIAFPSQCKSYMDLNTWIDEIIVDLITTIGLDIRVFVSALGSKFVGTSKLRSVSSEETYFTVNGRKIYCIFDVLHLINCLRDELTICDFIFDNKIARWSHVANMYDQERTKQIKLAPKLIDDHIYPKNLRKTNINYAAQVLSRSVASAIDTYIDLNLIDVAARDTADFINKINNLFDILNSKTLGSKKKFKRAFCGEHYQIQFLQDMLKFFKYLRLRKTGTEVDVTGEKSFIIGFKVSIKSVLQLYDDLKSAGIAVIYTRRLSLDAIRYVFDKVRRANGGQEPTCRKLDIAFKKFFVDNLLKRPETAKCNEDLESLLVKQLDRQVGPPTFIPDPILIGTADYRFNLPDQSSLACATIYLYRKCKEVHNCEKITSLSIPPESFVVYVKFLEVTACEYFDTTPRITNPGNVLLRNFDAMYKLHLPCECFPIDYLKKLFIRFRLYHMFKRNNKAWKDRNCKEKIFNVNLFDN